MTYDATDEPFTYNTPFSILYETDGKGLPIEQSVISLYFEESSTEVMPISDIPYPLTNE